MRVHLNPAVVATAILFVLAGTGLVRADVIDGEWCDESGRHFTINGPEIVTPEGTKTMGSYSRHAFSYTSPAGDAASGTPIFMRLVNELTVHLRVGNDASTPLQVWTRCQPVS